MKRISDAAYITLLSEKIGVNPIYIAQAFRKHSRNFEAIRKYVAVKYDD
jgi:hypothetical protein